MKLSRNRRITGIIILLTGIGILLNGLLYNLGHIGVSYPSSSDSFLRDNEVRLGYIIISITPIILRRYIWLIILIGLAIIFEAWIYVSTLQ
jgi:hypothetical protein